MHLGNARTALLAWLSARGQGGRIVLRIEDLDPARVVPGAEARLLDELRWLGLDWDEGPDVGGGFGPYRQSERSARYDAAVEELLARGEAFLCACSRADVARAASAPHEAGAGAGGAAAAAAGKPAGAPPLAEPEEPRYPGTCRALRAAEAEARARAHGRLPAVRFRGRGARVRFVDAIAGDVEPFGPAGVDDFVLRRSDGVAAYQLAVVVDDAAMAVTEVVRGDDLLKSTARQIALFRALGLSAPRFAHVPLVLAPGGERLAKRSRPAAVGDLRAAGLAPEVVVGALAASAGLCPPRARVRPADLVATFDPGRLAREPAALDPSALLGAARGPAGPEAGQKT
jgi:glutamyl-tRNA synthetase